MPDHAALAPAVGPELADARDQCTDAKELLIARDDLADLAVEQHKAAQQFQQAPGREQAGQQTVLVGGQHGRRPQRFKVLTQLRGLALEQCGLGVGVERLVLDCSHVRIAVLLFTPARPEFGGGVGRAVTAVGLADGEQKLRVGEEVRNLVLPLVAQVLADALLHHGLTVRV